MPTVGDSRASNNANAGFPTERQANMRQGAHKATLEYSVSSKDVQGQRKDVQGQRRDKKSRRNLMKRDREPHGVDLGEVVDIVLVPAIGEICLEQPDYHPFLDDVAPVNDDFAIEASGQPEIAVFFKKSGSDNGNESTSTIDETSATDCSFGDSSALSCEETNEAHSVTSVAPLADESWDFAAAIAQNENVDNPVVGKLFEEVRIRLQVLNGLSEEKELQACQIPDPGNRATFNDMSCIIDENVNMIPKEKYDVLLDYCKTKEAEIHHLSHAIRDLVGMILMNNSEIAFEIDEMKKCMDAPQPNTIGIALGFDLRPHNCLRSENEIERLRSRLDRMAPAALLDEAQNEIVNLREEIQTLEATIESSKEVHKMTVDEVEDCIHEIRILNRSLQSMVPKTDVITLQAEVDRLQKLLDSTVPNAKEHLLLLMKNDVLQDDIQENELEIQRLKACLKDTVPKGLLEAAEQEIEHLRSGLGIVDARDRNPIKEDRDSTSDFPGGVMDVNRGSTGSLPPDPTEGAIRPRKISFAGFSNNPLFEEYCKLETEILQLRSHLETMVPASLFDSARKEIASLKNEASQQQLTLINTAKTSEVQLANLRNELEDMKKLKEDMVPKKDFSVLLLEIERLQKLLDSTVPNAKEHLLLLMKNDVLQGDIQENELEIQRLKACLEDTVPKGLLEAAEQEIEHLRSGLGIVDARDRNPIKEDRDQIDPSLSSHRDSTGKLPDSACSDQAVKAIAEQRSLERLQYLDMELQESTAISFQTLTELCPNARQCLLEERSHSRESSSEFLNCEMIDLVPNAVFIAAQEEINRQSLEISRLQACLCSSNAAQKASQDEITKCMNEIQRLQERVKSATPLEIIESGTSSDSEARRHSRPRELASPRGRCDVQVLQWKIHLNSLLDQSSERPQPCSIEMIDSSDALLLNQSVSMGDSGSAEKQDILEDIGIPLSSQADITSEIRGHCGDTAIEIEKGLLCKGLETSCSHDDTIISEMEQELARFGQLVDDMDRLGKVTESARLQIVDSEPLAVSDASCSISERKVYTIVPKDASHACSSLPTDEEGERAENSWTHEDIAAEWSAPNLYNESFISVEPEDSGLGEITL